MYLFEKSQIGVNCKARIGFRTSDATTSKIMLSVKLKEKYHFYTHL